MVFQSHGGVSPKIISNHPVMVALGALAPQSLSSKRPFTAASTCQAIFGWIPETLQALLPAEKTMIKPENLDISELENQWFSEIHGFN